MVRQGQRLRIGRDLYRVKYVNQSGAFIVPDAKQHVVIGEREFDVDRPGMMVTNDLHTLQPFVEVL